MQTKMIAERLGLNGDIKELKLGKSFTSKDNSNGFHTIRCKSIVFYLSRTDNQIYFHFR